MTAEPRRYRLNDETRAKPLIEEAREGPVIVELDGKPYEVNVRAASPPSFTAQSAYGSLPLLTGREAITDEELDDIIKRANEQHAREMIEQMRNE